jgi:hypothetical protein
MDKFVARLNIDHLREALTTETDTQKRKTLARLLAEEQAKLVAALDNEKQQNKG